MTLPSSVVNTVNITVGGAFPQRAGFGIYAMFSEEAAVDSVLWELDPIRFYGDSTEVGNDFGTSSEVYKGSLAYFGQNPRPQTFAVATRFAFGTGGRINGGIRVLGDTSIPSGEQLDPLLSVSDGEFSFELDTVEYTVAGIDFTSDVTEQDMAATITAAMDAVLSGSRCVYKNSRFYILGPLASTTMNQVGTDAPDVPVGSYIGTRLGTDEALTGQVSVTVGLGTQEVSEGLAKVQEFNDSWFQFGFTKTVRDLVAPGGASNPGIQDAGVFALANNKISYGVSNSLATIDSGDSTDIASVCLAAGLERTSIVYQDVQYVAEYPEIAAAARLATVDLNSENTSITMDGKNLIGITVTDLSTSQFNALEAKRCNVLTTIGGVRYYRQGFTSSTSGTRFVDTAHGISWLNDAINVELLGAQVATTTKLSMTDEGGVATLESRLRFALDQAVRSGLGAPGFKTDGTYLPDGYEVTATRVANVSQSEKDARIYNGFTFTLLGAGAIHSTVVNGTFEGS